MLGRLLLILLLLFAAYLLFRKLNRLSPQQRSTLLSKLLLWGGAAALLLLITTGHLSWLFAIGAAMIPFTQRLARLMRLIPILQQLQSLFKRQSTSKGSHGRENARYQTTASLQMEFCADSGQIGGEVLRGRFKGFTLDELTQPQLKLLYDELDMEGDSRQLLEAYLRFRFGDQWARWSQPHPHEEEDDEYDPPSGRRGGMSRKEALKVLGLEESASRDDILQAHRRLMLKIHPDRGGSDYLAAKLNQAKKRLLGK